MNKNHQKQKSIYLESVVVIFDVILFAQNTHHTKYRLTYERSWCVYISFYSDISAALPIMYMEIEFLG